MIELLRDLALQQWFWGLLVPLITAVGAYWVNRRKKQLDFDGQVRDGRLKEIEYYKNSLANARNEVAVLEAAVIKWKTKYYGAYELVIKINALMSSIDHTLPVRKPMEPILHEIDLFLKLEQQTDKPSN